MLREKVEFAVGAAERLNETLNAFLEIDREGAVERAAEIEKRATAKSGEQTGGEQTRAADREQTLAGMPIAVKDNICVRGMQASCGSRILGDYHPPYNATVIERLINAGAVIIGKTNCDEFAIDRKSVV